METLSIHISVVSKDKRLADRISELTKDKEYLVSWRDNSRDIVSLVRKERFDIVILTDDATTGDASRPNKKLVESITRASPSTQILFLAHADSIENVISTLESGTYQYAKQPLSDDELGMLIEVALRDRVVIADESPAAEVADRLGQIIGRAPSMQSVYKLIKRAAKSDIPVLVLGETGTGKDLVAQVIHRRSQRRKSPLVSINLGALPTDLVASELFGHEKGAFSGAIGQHQGVFERADDGTVFLDEIDCIDEKVRVSLLRVLDQKSFRRLGGSEVVQSQARLVAATNADLEEMVAEGEFREDLFYRLDAFRITLPPLRSRMEDIPPLVQEFAAVYSRANDREPLRVSREFLEILLSYSWPGNVRELKSVIHRAVLMCDTRELKPRHLPPRFKKTAPRPNNVTFEVGTPLDEIERTMVLRALEMTDNNRKEAAKLLGISRRVIYNKLKKHGID